MRYISKLLVILTGSILLPVSLHAQEENSIPYQMVDVKPSFNGGDVNEFSKWVNSRLIYPVKARENCDQGRVIVQFTIKTDGSVADVRILRSVSPELDAEAVRVVSSSPKWTPGMLDGIPVDVLYAFPLIFKIHTPEPTPVPETAPSSASTESVPFQLIQQKPSFNGGDANEFSKWVNSRLIYPEKAKAEKIQGRVVLQFTIKADGTVADVHVLRGADPDLDAEAIRVVSSSPKWKPGEQDGVPVNVIYTFPVIFQLR